MKTAVVILNWNGEMFLRKFLPALLESVEGTDAEVIVADNASTDGSMKLMLYEFPKVKTIRFSKNYGFTGGYNRALFQTDAEYYVLINSDIEVRKGWLEPMVEWMDTHPECGICAPKLHSYRDRDMFEYNMPGLQEAISTDSATRSAGAVFLRKWKRITDSMTPLPLYSGQAEPV